MGVGDGVDVMVGVSVMVGVGVGVHVGGNVGLPTAALVGKRDVGRGVSWITGVPAPHAANSSVTNRKTGSPRVNDSLNTIS